jgi:hypothetical protein
MKTTVTASFAGIGNRGACAKLLFRLFGPCYFRQNPVFAQVFAAFAPRRPLYRDLLLQGRLRITGIVTGIPRLVANEL